MLHQETKYGTLDIPIWVDDFDDDVTQWVQGYCSDEATEVLQAIGALVFCAEGMTIEVRLNCAWDWQLNWALGNWKGVQGHHYTY